MPLKDEAFFLSFTSVLETLLQIYRNNKDLVYLNAVNVLTFSCI